MSGTVRAGDENPQDAAKAPEPFLTVVKGTPTDEELAALVTVLSTAGGESTPAAGPVDDWGRPTDMHRVSWGMPSSYPNRG